MVITAEEFRRFRFVTTNCARTMGWMLTDDAELAQSYDHTAYKRSPGITEYECRFTNDSVEAALAVMRERNQQTIGLI